MRQISDLWAAWSLSTRLLVLIWSGGCSMSAAAALGYGTPAMDERIEINRPDALRATSRRQLVLRRLQCSFSLVQKPSAPVPLRVLNSSRRTRTERVVRRHARKGPGRLQRPKGGKSGWLYGPSASPVLPLLAMLLKPDARAKADHAVNSPWCRFDTLPCLSDVGGPSNAHEWNTPPRTSCSKQQGRSSCAACRYEG